MGRASGRGAPVRRRSLTTRVLVSCEHGGNRVPEALVDRFEGAEAVLASHRGWDPGALGLARFLAEALGAPLHSATVTRLVVDLNRSPGHPRVFSEYTRGLPRGARADLLARYHAPYRSAVDAQVGAWLGEGARVVHLGVHSFTPVLDGSVRRADVALLYDPARTEEWTVCGRWAASLAGRLPELAVRRNQPYRGASDGLTTWLRRHGPGYLGIEIEVNQRLLTPEGEVPARVARALVGGLADAGVERGSG